MNYDRRQNEPVLDLSEIVPTCREVFADYSAYLSGLGNAIQSFERADELQSQIRSLLRADYNTTIPELLQAELYGQMLERIVGINPESHVFSLNDISPIRQLVAMNLGEDEPDDLFLKICDFERTLNRNTELFGGGKVLDSFPIADLQSCSDKELHGLSAEEFAQCISYVRAAREEGLSGAERKVSARDGTIAECGTALLEEIGRQPLLLSEVRRLDNAMRTGLETFNGWAIDSYQRSELSGQTFPHLPSLHAVASYLKWRYQMLGILSNAVRKEDDSVRSPLLSSWEDKLGARSGINHFDVFLARPREKVEFFRHFHEPLSMQLFLAITNPFCDALIYQGAEGVISTDRLVRGSDFIVPAFGGVVQSNQVTRSIASQTSQ